MLRRHKKVRLACYSLQLVSILIVLSMMFVACTTDSVDSENQTPESTVTEKPSPTTLTEAPLPSPTATEHPSPTPALTSAPSAMPLPSPTRVFPTPALSALSGSDFYFGEFFFEEAFSPDCSLPCWRGLRIGESTSDDVLQVFEDLFGPTNFDSAGLWAFGADTPIQNIYSRGFNYRRDAGDVYGVAAFDDATDELQFLGFTWHIENTSEFEVHMSPQFVIRQLGPPDYMFAAPGLISEQVLLLIVYEDGIVFEYLSEVADFDKETWRYCFAMTEHRIGNSLTLGSIYIVGSFVHGLDDLSPLQDATVSHTIRSQNLQAFESLFDVSQDEVIERIMEEDNTCLEY